MFLSNRPNRFVNREPVTVMLSSRSRVDTCYLISLVKMATTTEQLEKGFFANILDEIVTSPLNLSLVFLIAFLIYKIFRNKESTTTSAPSEPPLPKLKKRDFTVEELRKYDGNQPDGRVLVAVNGNVYDVTKGKRFYGPGK